MMTPQNSEQDVVTRLIRYCHLDTVNAERLFDALVTERRHEIDLPEGRIRLSDEHLDEFVARYSAEVEPTLWTSKRRKM